VSTTRHKSRIHPFAAVVVIGSSGALQAFQAILAVLPGTFPAAVVFDLHRGETYGAAEEVLSRRGRLPVTLATKGMPVDAANLYLAPHDRQLIVTEQERFDLLGPGEGPGHRFADTLLVSAAQAFGPALIAVVLSGRLGGGAKGVREVMRQGGRVIVQDPETAIAPSMPNAALATGCVDFALAPDSLGHALVALCAAPGAAELFRVRLNAGVSS
jgi:two-component system, chemotaxis family, protein-glutamate methylesterase/glutaminase